MFIVSQGKDRFVSQVKDLNSLRLCPTVPVTHQKLTWPGLQPLNKFAGFVLTWDVTELSQCSVHGCSALRVLFLCSLTPVCACLQHAPVHTHPALYTFTVYSALRTLMCAHSLCILAALCMLSLLCACLCCAHMPNSLKTCCFVHAHAGTLTPLCAHIRCSVHACTGHTCTLTPLPAHTCPVHTHSAPYVLSADLP